MSSAQCKIAMASASLSSAGGSPCPRGGDHRLLRGVALARGVDLDGADGDALIGHAAQLGPGGERCHQSAVDVRGVRADVPTDLFEPDRGDRPAQLVELGQPVGEAEVAHAAAVVAAGAERHRAAGDQAVGRRSAQPVVVPRSRARRAPRATSAGPPARAGGSVVWGWSCIMKAHRSWAFGFGREQGITPRRADQANSAGRLAGRADFRLSPPVTTSARGGDRKRFKNNGVTTVTTCHHQIPIHHGGRQVGWGQQIAYVREEMWWCRW